MSDLCPKCGGGVWPGREVTRCVDPFHTLNAPQPPPTSDDASPEVWPALLDEVALSPELRALWESINGADSWVANPWVWVVAFKRVTP